MAIIPHYFPEEIWYQILQRLPSISLCRFLSVSKPWCRLITSKEFISSHLNQTLVTETNTHIFLNVNHHTLNNPEEEFLLYPHAEEFLIYPHAEEFLFYPHNQITCKEEDAKSLGVPSFVAKLPSYLMHQQIIGSCNGLICLTGHSDITLFNPSIRRVVISPPFCTMKFSKNCWHVFGFGVNPSNGDFKVVRVVRELVTSPPKVLAEVYSLETGEWVEINGFESNIHNLCISQVYLHGRSHWIDSNVRKLISFDMREETFGEVSVPHKLGYDQRLGTVRLATLTLGGEECIAAIIQCIAAIILDQSMSYDICVMKEYGDSESWSRMYHIDMRPTPELSFGGFLKNGYLLMTGNPKSVTRYDLHRDSALIMEYTMAGSGFLMESLVMYADKYMESLVLLESPFENID